MVKANKIITILGKSGSGKSYLFNYIIRCAIENGKRGVLIDYSGEHLTLANEYKDVYVLNVTSEILERLNASILSRIFEEFRWIIITPEGLDFEQMRRLGNKIAEAVYKTGNMVLAVEEAHLFCPNERILKWIQVCVTTGRKLGIDMIFVTPRAADIDSRIISQSNLRIAFQLDEENDLRKVSPFFDNAREVLPNLRKFEYVMKDTFSGEPFNSLF